MNYTPQEGIDYITDLYAVVGVEPDAAPDDIKTAINTGTRQYHPDRLQDLAPEFRHKGERMIRLLNKARTILLDGDKRSEYDEILEAWEGPVSKTGVPTITVAGDLQAQLARKTPDELAQELDQTDSQIDNLAKSNSGLVAMLGQMVEQAGEHAPEQLTEQYEAALLAEDRNLAIKEAQRVDMLGMPSLENRQFRASLEYEADVTTAIEARKVEYVEQARSLALGNAAGRLALLAGETAPLSSGAVVAHESVPAYFEVVADQVVAIAAKRQAITEQRLKLFTPLYPEIGAQVDGRAAMVIGVNTNNPRWFCAAYDADTESVDFVDMPSEVFVLLDNKDYLAVINAGYNVMMFDTMEQIDLHDQLGEAVDKYVAKFFPGKK